MGLYDVTLCGGLLGLGIVITCANFHVMRK